jgi:threonine synthase
MLGVQAEGAAPITKSFLTGADAAPMEPESIADSIAVGVPRNWRKALLAIWQSDGFMINVADEEILDAMRYTGRLAGVFAEPAAAASVAGLRRAVSSGVMDSRSTALAMITGNGLKDTQSARIAVGEPFAVGPRGAGLSAILRRQKLAE